MSWNETTRFLLSDVEIHTGEERREVDASGRRGGAMWNGLAIKGRFRTDPADQVFGGIDPGLGTTQTWFWCDRAAVPAIVDTFGYRVLPDLGDHLLIRGVRWEIVQRDEDDLGELALRLIRSLPLGDARELPGAIPSPALPETRRPGRPSRHKEIVETFEAATEAGIIDPAQPLRELAPVLRQRIGGDARGLGDKTLRKTLAPLIGARRLR